MTAAAGRGSFRLLLFADPGAPTSLALAAAVLAAAPEAGLEVVGVVDARRRPAPSALRGLAARAAIRVLDPRAVPETGPLRPPAPLLVPPGRDVNDPAFVADVRGRLRPDAALNLLSTQLFRPPLLDACRAPVNFHDGLLPRYRGVGATAWSVYDGAARSGFAFHRMTAGLDDGPILLADAVDVPVGATTGRVWRTKMRLATARLPDALRMVASGAPGTEQVGEPSAFTRAERRAMRAVGDPSALSYDELQRRLRAFERLDVELAGARWDVTALRRARRPGPLTFRAADGVLAEPQRCSHLPAPLYRALRSVRR